MKMRLKICCRLAVGLNRLHSVCVWYMCLLRILWTPNFSVFWLIGLKRGHSRTWVSNTLQYVSRTLCEINIREWFFENLFASLSCIAFIYTIENSNGIFDNPENQDGFHFFSEIWKFCRRTRSRSQISKSESEINVREWIPWELIYILVIHLSPYTSMN